RTFTNRPLTLSGMVTTKLSSLCDPGHRRRIWFEGSRTLFVIGHPNCGPALGVCGSKMAASCTFAESNMGHSDHPLAHRIFVHHRRRLVHPRAPAQSSASMHL